MVSRDGGREGARMGDSTLSEVVTENSEGRATN